MSVRIEDGDPADGIRASFPELRRVGPGRAWETTTRDWSLLLRTTERPPWARESVQAEWEEGLQVGDDVSWSPSTTLRPIVEEPFLRHGAQAGPNNAALIFGIVFGVLGGLFLILCLLVLLTHSCLGRDVRSLWRERGSPAAAETEPLATERTQWTHTAAQPAQLDARPVTYVDRPQAVPTVQTLPAPQPQVPRIQVIPAPTVHHQL